jgi:flagellar basal body-associated protein FliL
MQSVPYLVVLIVSVAVVASLIGLAILWMVGSKAERDETMEDDFEKEFQKSSENL